MLRKSGMLVTLFFLMLHLGIAASAAEVTGTIRITLDTNGGEVTLYPVGTPAASGYRLRGTYGGGYIQEKDANSPMLALWLAETQDEGVQRILDADGSACFSNLEAGLYLVKHTDELADEVAAPFLVQLPYQGQWEVDATPTKTKPMEQPKTGQDPGIYFGLAGMLLSATGLLCCSMVMSHRKRIRPQ